METVGNGRTIYLSIYLFIYLSIYLYPYTIHNWNGPRPGRESGRRASQAAPDRGQAGVAAVENADGALAFAGAVAEVEATRKDATRSSK